MYIRHHVRVTSFQSLNITVLNVANKHSNPKRKGFQSLMIQPVNFGVMSQIRREICRLLKTKEMESKGNGFRKCIIDFNSFRPIRVYFYFISFHFRTLFLAHATFFFTSFSMPFPSMSLKLLSPNEQLGGCAKIRDLS